MKKRQLGSTNIYVSEIGLGCASYWGKVAFSEREATNVVCRAIDSGVTLFDTGHSYSDGNAEMRLGRCIANLRDKSAICISTKAGTRISTSGKLYKDFSPAWLRESCYLSLKRIGIESIALFHLHGPTIEDLNDDVLNELARLKREGLVNAIGVNSFDDLVLERILALGAFDFVMPDYNILSLDREPLIESFHRRGIGVIAGAALADSLFSNRVFALRSTKDLWYFARALKSFRGKLLKGFAFRFVNNFKDYSGPQVAIAYVLQNPHICSAVFGTTSEAHLAENLAAAEIVLPDEVLQRIRRGKAEMAS